MVNHIIKVNIIIENLARLANAWYSCWLLKASNLTLNINIEWIQTQDGVAKLLESFQTNLKIGLFLLIN